MKKLKQSNEVHTGAVLTISENLKRLSSKKMFIDENGQKKRRYKLWQRERIYRVVIADSKESRCDEVLVNFLKQIKTGIVIDGSWVGIELGNPDWVDEQDSVLKSKTGVQFTVTFDGGIYEDKEMKKISAKVQIKKEELNGNN